jgi:ABC-type multidrug transport system fused ATPase/permease subunit
MRLWRQLSPRRKRQFTAVTGLVVLSALAEVVSLGAVLPFLAVLTSPERVLKYPVVVRMMDALGIGSLAQLVLILAGVFALAALMAGASRMLVLWVSMRVAYAAGADFSCDVYRRTLYQGYEIHIMRNSSELISGITGKVADTVNVLSLLLTLLNACVLLVFITIALFVIDPVAGGWESTVVASPANTLKWSKHSKKGSAEFATFCSMERSPCISISIARLTMLCAERREIPSS